MHHFSIATLPGDGVGPEITRACIDILNAVQKKVGGFALNFEYLKAGAGLFRDTGVIFPQESYDACCKADAILLGAMGLPDVVQEDGTEVQGKIIIELRKNLNLFAGVRPIKLYPGIQSPLRDKEKIDFVIIRESTEGLFASYLSGASVYDKVHVDSMVITREGTEKVCEYAFQCSLKRNGRPLDGKRVVTCVDKANNFKGMAFWRKIYNEIANNYPTVQKDYAYVDAINVFLIQNPENYDVLVAENIYGDIISDMAAALVGGMGMAPSADIGLEHAMFQPAHGSAPTIAGKNIANPVATILSGAMMLEWMGERKGCEEARTGSKMIHSAVEETLARGLKTTDVGGKASTTGFTEAVISTLRSK